MVIEELKDYLAGNNSSEKYHLFLPQYKDYTWGISVYEKLLEYLNWLSDISMEIDNRVFLALYEHKKLMAARFCFLKENGIYEIEMQKLLEIEGFVKKADIIRLLAMKYNCNHKKIVINKIHDLLLELMTDEAVLYKYIIMDMGK